MITQVYLLSIDHLPHLTFEEGDFLPLEVVPHEFGCFVILGDAYWDDKEEHPIPDWLWPIYKEARRLDCEYINFDHDAPRIEEFQIFVTEKTND